MKTREKRLNWQSVQLSPHENKRKSSEHLDVSSCVPDDLNLPRPDALHRASPNSSVSTSGGPSVSLGLAAPTIRQSSSQPYLGPDQPSSPPSLRNVFSNRLNVWTSNSSLSPSIKTLSSIGNTPRASMGSHINYFVQSRSVSSRGSSLSFNMENISPYSNRTLPRPLHHSLSPSGCTAGKGISPCSPMKGTSPDVSNCIN